jgi:hypothetical protein
MPSLKVEELKMRPSLHNAEFDEMALMPSGEYDGAGKHTLMDHLAAPMKGFGDYLHAFEMDKAPAVKKAKKGGMKTGKYEGEGTGGIKVRPVAGATQKARNWLAHRLPMVQAGMVALESAIYAAQHALQLNAAEKRFVERELRRRGVPDPEGTESDEEAEEITGEGATPSMGLSQFRGGMAMGQVVGSGKMKAAMDSDSESDMEGCGPAPAPVPAGKKKRASAGPDDGRRKRAAVVRKVMADKGLSMIEASKYVKAHGLYKP